MAMHLPELKVGWVGWVGGPMDRVQARGKGRGRQLLGTCVPPAASAGGARQGRAWWCAGWWVAACTDCAAPPPIEGDWAEKKLPPPLQPPLLTGHCQIGQRQDLRQEGRDRGADPDREWADCRAPTYPI